MRSLVLRAAAVALALTALPNAADAGWEPGYNGNSQLVAPSARADGVINFAVYKTEDADWTDDFGAGFDAAVRTFMGSTNVAVGSYIYFYQVVNTNPNNPESSLSNLYLASSGSLNAAGTVDGYLFTEGSGPGSTVGPVGNQRLGAENGPNDSTVNGVPSNGTTPPSGFVFNSGAVNIGNYDDDDEAFPDNTPGDESDDIPARKFSFSNTLAVDMYSSVAFLISPNAPKYGMGSLQDGGYTRGDVPVPSPEPGTFALLGLGLPLLGWGYARRLRASKAVAEAVA